MFLYQGWEILKWTGKKMICRLKRSGDGAKLNSCHRRGGWVSLQPEFFLWLGNSTEWDWSESAITQHYSTVKGKKPHMAIQNLHLQWHLFPVWSPFWIICRARGSKSCFSRLQRLRWISNTLGWCIQQIYSIYYPPRALEEGNMLIYAEASALQSALVFCLMKWLILYEGYEKQI